MAAYKNNQDTVEKPDDTTASTQKSVKFMNWTMADCRPYGFVFKMEDLVVIFILKNYGSLEIMSRQKEKKRKDNVAILSRLPVLVNLGLRHVRSQVRFKHKQISQEGGNSKTTNETIASSKSMSSSCIMRRSKVFLVVNLTAEEEEGKDIIAQTLHHISCYEVMKNVQFYKSPENLSGNTLKNSMMLRPKSVLNFGSGIKVGWFSPAALIR